MATLSTSKDGLRTIQVRGRDHKRRSIRLGKIPLRAAEQIRLRVGLIETAIRTGTPFDPSTADWLTEIGDDLHSRIAQVGLVPERRGSLTVSGFIRGYIASRKDLKPGTIDNLKQAADYAVEFFGESKLLHDVTPGDGDDFRRWLMERIGENTARRHCGRLKQFFRAAHRRKLIPDHPLADMKDVAVRASDPSRVYFLSEADSLRVLNECPTLQWKLIFALARWQALRTPSEHLRLRWCDLDFENRKMLIHQPKMETRGKPTRTMPIFEPVLSLMLELRDIVQPGIDCKLSDPIIHADRGAAVNWRQTFEKIVKRAGVKPWPKTFQTLRSTRETELAASLPLHVVTAFCGNTEHVAAKHYLQITDEHFRLAGNLDVLPENRPAMTFLDTHQTANLSAFKAVQNPVQYTSEYSGIEGNLKSKTPRNSFEFRGVSSHSSEQAPPRGFEPRSQE